MPTRIVRTARPATRRRAKSLQWVTFDQSFTPPVGPPIVSNVDLLATQELPGLTSSGVTVMRTHLYLSVPQLEGNRYEIGVGVLRKTDIGTAHPNVNGDLSLDWALVRPLFNTFDGAVVNANEVYHIDLRSRRRIEDQGLTWAMSLWLSGGTPAPVRCFARTLLMLH